MAIPVAPAPFTAAAPGAAPFSAPYTAPFTAPYGAPPTVPSASIAPAAGAATPPGRRHLRPRPIGWALTILAVLSLCLWLASRQRPQLAVSGAILVAIGVDALLARGALANLAIEVHAGDELVAGRPTRWTMRVTGVRRPISVAPAVLPRSHEVRVDTEVPGGLTLPALSRGLLQSLLLDVTAMGPAGFFQAGQRHRVRLAVPAHVGPPSVGQRVDWPRLRAVRFGATEVAPIGDDLFRSVRPYVRGDSRRRVHWKATAHHGTLMVSESDGTGMVALRIVVDLPGRGPIADVTAGRAAWLAEEGLRRGWVVYLVTMAPEHQPIEPVVPLGSPFGSPPLNLQLPPGPVHAVQRRVTSTASIRRELAVACGGTPGLGRWHGLTCVVTPDGLEWR